MISKKGRMTVYLAMMLFILAVQSTSVFSQNKYTIAGEIRDAETGENLIGATVYIENTAQGVISNTYGFYSITLKEGFYNLVISYIGYEGERRALRLEADMDLNIQLRPSQTVLEEVTISAQRADHNVSSTDIGVENLSLESLAKVPVFMGEKDILKTIQLMPGISTISEGSSGYSVRGGSVDQNLILLDEAPVYSASHLLGFFSVFNADALKDGKIYKGGIPANFGGRASSVLDIQMKDGNNQKVATSGGLGLISSRLTLEGPITKSNGSFIVSGRRSYADLVAKGFGIIEDNVTLYFYDLNVKMNYKIGDKDKIFLSGYFGRDEFGFEQFGTSWGNVTGTLRWNHLYGKRLFGNTTFIYSNFDYGFNFDETFKLSSGIEDLGLKQDFTLFINPENTMKFGLNSTYHTFNPGEIQSAEGDSIFDIDIVLAKKQAIETGAFISNKTTFNSRISAEYGVRYSMFNQLGEGMHYVYNDFNERIDSISYDKGEVMTNYKAFEPRISANYRLSDKSSVKASYNRMAQYLHLLSNSTSGQPTDTWVPSTVGIEPVKVNQYSVGYFRNFFDNKVEFSLEGYYKQMYNIIDYEDGAEVMFNEDVEADILSGEGRSYGLEFYLKKKYGKFSGWVSYTLSNTENIIEGINYGKWYPSSYDKTHDLALVANLEFTERLSLSASWIYYTGNAVTFPSGKYVYDGKPVSYYTERNGYRMPDYHRLDLNLHLDGKNKRKVKSSWDLSVYNAYHRYNAYVISFRESEINPGTTEAVKLALFGIVPSIRWNFKF
ncbi:MAG: TonB-dependent receptor [Bacteroidales bacterium]|nr:TonB-dependent receptor [Bacteroidales bacterium]